MDMRDNLLSTRILEIKTELGKTKLSIQGEKMDAVVAILLWDDPNSALQVLLVQRAERKGDPWSGQIGLPGGRVKQSDSSSRSALQREVEEEVGVKLNEVGVELGNLSAGHPMRRTGMKVQPWVYALTVRPHVILGSEIADSFWANLEQLPATLRTSDIVIRNENFSVESFVVDGKVIWGFTFRVLTELLPILKLSS